MPATNKDQLKKTLSVHKYTLIITTSILMMTGIILLILASTIFSPFFLALTITGTIMIVLALSVIAAGFSIGVFFQPNIELNEELENPDVEPEVDVEQQRVIVTQDILLYLEAINLPTSIGETLSFEQIKNAYRKTLLKVHPDHNYEPNAADKFNAVRSAYEKLIKIIQNNNSNSSSSSLSTALHAYFANQNDELTELSFRFQDIQQGIHTLDSNIAELEQNIQRFKSDLQRSQDNIDECQEIIASNHQQLTQFDAKIDKLVASVAQFSDSAAQFDASADQFSASAAQFDASANQFSASVDQFSASAAQFDASADQCSVHLSELTTNMENLTIKINSAVAQSEANEVIIKQNAQVSSQIKTDLCQLMREFDIEIPDELKSTGIASSRFAFMPPPRITQGAYSLNEELTTDLVVSEP